MTSKLYEQSGVDFGEKYASSSQTLNYVFMIL